MNKISMTTPGPDVFSALRTAEGCPVCQALSKVEFDLMAEFQFNTSAYGEDFLDSNCGSDLCQAHLKLFGKISSAKVTAALLYYLIEKGKALPNMVQTTGQCPICSALTKVEISLVEAYLTEIDHTFSEDFLCLQHMNIVINDSRFIKLIDPKKLYDKYSISILRLKEQLKGIQNKNYYSSTQEERSSIWRAVAKLAGKTFLE